MIPIYRAKKIDSDEYVEGYFEDLGDKEPHLERYIIRERIKHNNYPRFINIATLAIHFPDMLDSEGTKIFASLSEDGKGGDIVYIAGKGTCYITFDLDGAYATIIDNNGILDDLFPLSESLMENDVEKVTGIQQ